MQEIYLNHQGGINMIYKYIRFSTDSQDERQQENTIDNWLKSKGMTADSVIKDNGVSGGTSYKERNLFNLVRGLQLNDTLIVSEVSRLTRSGFGELNELIQNYFKPNNLRLIICNVGLDIDCSEISAMTELQLSMLSIFAKMEKELIVGRTKSALATRKQAIERDGGFMSASGKWTTALGRQKGERGVPTGEAVRQAAKRKIGADEARKRQWLLIHGMRQKGETMAQIAETMNAIGEKTPRGADWTAAQVSLVLSRWNKYFLKTEKI